MISSEDGSRRKTVRQQIDLSTHNSGGFVSGLSGKALCIKPDIALNAAQLHEFPCSLELPSCVTAEYFQQQ